MLRMEITEVKVFPVRDKKLRAFASIVFNGSFMVNDIKIIQGKDGFFISMPSRRKKNGRFKDIAHPLNQETRQVLEDRIIAEYQRLTEGGDEAQPREESAAEARPEAEVRSAPMEASPESDAAPEEAVAESRQEEPPEAEAKSLDEVAEAHLSDSYWTT